MSRYRRIRITTATREVIALQRPVEPANDFCKQCGKEVGWLGLTDAAAVCQISARAIVIKIESGTFHHRETIDGRLRICRNSILANDPDPKAINAT